MFSHNSILSNIHLLRSINKVEMLNTTLVIWIWQLFTQYVSHVMERRSRRIQAIIHYSL